MAGSSALAAGNGNGGGSFSMAGHGLAGSVALLAITDYNDSNPMMPTPKNPFLNQYWTSAKMVLYQMRGMMPRISRIPKIPKIPKIPVILIQNKIGQPPYPL